MSLKKYSGGAWSEVSGVKRLSGGSWADCESVKKYSGGAWSEVWSNGTKMKFLRLDGMIELMASSMISFASVGSTLQYASSVRSNGTIVYFKSEKADFDSGAAFSFSAAVTYKVSSQTAPCYFNLRTYDTGGTLRGETINCLEEGIYSNRKFSLDLDGYSGKVFFEIEIIAAYSEVQLYVLSLNYNNHSSGHAKQIQFVPYSFGTYQPSGGVIM